MVSCREGERAAVWGGDRTARWSYKTMTILKGCHLFIVLVASLVHCQPVQGLASASTTIAASFSPPKATFSEISIDANDTAEGKTIGERIKYGESIVEIHNLVTPEECAYLVDACLEAAEAEAASTTKRQLSEKASPGLVRLPTIAAAERAAATDTLCANALPSNVDEMLQNIFRRATEYIDDELPSITSTLFKTTTARTAEEDSLLTTRLKFSSREPAVNVYYAPGGQFLAHTDSQALTLLLPLSDPQHHFEGGGTYRILGAKFPWSSSGKAVVGSQAGGRYGVAFWGMRESCGCGGGGRGEGGVCG